MKTDAMTQESVLVQNLLARPDMHQQWKQRYRTADNDKFFERAFDYVMDVIKPTPGAKFLDAGCGSCAHSVRLARRGFKVQAVDFSESALAMAQQYIAAKRLSDKITLSRESLLDLSFARESFDYVLCWGVLMHIPEVGQAVSELARVLKPGGFLVISEANNRALEALAVRNLRKVLRKESAQVREAVEGTEYWKEKNGDMLVTREANISWLIRACECHGLKLRKRVAGQLSESYTRVSASSLKRFIHTLNNFWFKRIRWAAPAFGNLLIFEKQR